MDQGSNWGVIDRGLCHWSIFRIGQCVADQPPPRIEFLCLFGACSLKILSCGAFGGIKWQKTVCVAKNVSPINLCHFIPFTPVRALIFWHFWLKICIFDNFVQKSTFLDNVDLKSTSLKIWGKNKHFWQLCRKIDIFDNFCQKSIFSRILTQNRHFSQFRHTIGIFENFWPNSTFATIMTPILHFRQYWTQIDISDKCDLKPTFSTTLTQNLSFRKKPKINLFDESGEKSNLRQIWSKIDTFETFDSNGHFRPFWPKIDIFTVLTQNQNKSTILIINQNIFHKSCPKSKHFR